MAKKSGSVDAGRLFLENRKKFDQLPDTVKADCFRGQCASAIQAIRTYGRKLWRDPVIYCSAAPSNNIPLVVGHLRMALSELEKVSGETFLGVSGKVPVWAQAGHSGCLRESACRREAMKKRGGRRAEAARIVEDMEAAGLLWKRGDDIEAVRAALPSRAADEPETAEWSDVPRVTARTDVQRPGSCLVDVDVEGLSVWTGNTRKHDPHKLNELTASVLACGILQPLLGRPVGGTYGPGGMDGDWTCEIVCGAGRLEAARRAGMSSVPVFVSEMTDREAAVAVASENMQRQDLSPIELCEAVRPVLAVCGGDMVEAAYLLGRSVNWTRRAASIDGLASMWKMAAERCGLEVLDGVPLSFAFLAALARLPGPVQADLFEEYGRKLQEGGGNIKLLRELTDARLAEIGRCDWLKHDEACAACQKRTDAQADLFVDLGPVARCMDPVCRDAKRREFIEAQKVRAAQTAGIEPQQVCESERTASRDSVRKTARHTVPVVISKGESSGCVVWREPAPEPVRRDAGGDVTPKGPSADDRAKTKMIRATAEAVGIPGFLEKWVEENGWPQIAGALVVFGIAPETVAAEDAEETVSVVAGMASNDWVKRLAKSVAKRLDYSTAAERADAFAWAQAVRSIFGVPGGAE